MSSELEKTLTGMMETRQAVFAKLKDLPPADLKLANPETKRSIRQIISMYMSHERNHIMQIEKTRRAIGSQPTEVQMLLAQAWESRGDLIASLMGMNDEEIGKKPAEDAWSVKEILEHIEKVEKWFLSAIEEIIAKTKAE